MYPGSVAVSQESFEKEMARMRNDAAAAVRAEKERGDEVERKLQESWQREREGWQRERAGWENERAMWRAAVDREKQALEREKQITNQLHRQRREQRVGLSARTPHNSSR